MHLWPTRNPFCVLRRINNFLRWFSWVFLAGCWKCANETLFQKKTLKLGPLLYQLFVFELKLVTDQFVGYFQINFAKKYINYFGKLQELIFIAISEALP